MRYIHYVFLSAAILFLSAVGQVSAEMTSSSYRLATSVLSGTAGVTSSGSYRVSAAMGQVAAGVSSSTNSIVGSGFWYTVMLTLSAGDVNGDGAVNLEDLISTLQVITGQSPEQIFRAADMDGDNKIGIMEAIRILQELRQ